MIDRVGQVWMLPLSWDSTGGDDLFCPCLVLWGEITLIQPKMSEHRPEKRVEVPVLVVLNLFAGELDRWYEHVPLEREVSSEIRRVDL